MAKLFNSVPFGSVSFHFPSPEPSSYAFSLWEKAYDALGGMRYADNVAISGAMA